MSRRWLARTLLPWLAVTVAVLGCGVLLNSAEPGLPSLVLLLARWLRCPALMAFQSVAQVQWQPVAGGCRVVGS